MNKKRKKNGLSLSSKIAMQATRLKQNAIKSSKVVSVRGKVSKSKIQGSSILSSLRNLEPSAALHSLRNNLSDNISRNIAIDCIFPKNLQIKSSTRYIESNHGLAFDISFEALVLTHFGKELDAFLIEKEKFDIQILNSNLCEAEIILEKIFNNFGYSNWYLSSKINLMYEKGQTKKIVNYRNEISEAFKKNNYNNLSEVYVSYPFVRCDKGVSYERYQFSIQHQSEEFSLNNDNSNIEIIHFSHFYSPEKKYSCFSDLIAENSANNIIDRYLGFRRILSTCTIHSLNISDSKEYLKELNLNLNDKFLKNILTSLNFQEATLDDTDRYFIEICDLYVQGKYSDVVKKTVAKLKTNPNFTVVIEIFIKSLIRSNQTFESDSVIGIICNKIMRLYTSKSKHEIIKSLQKDYLRFHHCDWAYFIKLHCDKFEIRKPVEETYLFLDLVSSVANPFSKFKISDDILSKYNIKSVSFNLLSNDIDKINSIENIDDNRLLKIKGDYFYNKKDYQKSTIYYEDLCNSEDPLYKDHALSNIIKCDFNTDNYDKAIDELAKLITQGKGEDLLPIKEAFDYIYNESNRNLDILQLINRAIIVNQHCKNERNEDNELTSLLSEDILDTLNIQQVDDINIPDGNIYRYFFEEILTSDVLEKCEIFGSIEEVYIFRITLIQKLISSSETDDDNLQSELFNNIEKLIKEFCIIECGTGRIEVDILSIKNILLEKLKDSFNTLKKIDKTPFLESDYSEVIKEKDSYTISSNEFFTQTLDMYYKIRDSYTISPSHGLDYFLNMNIRHGGIVNLLWGPIKKYKLAYLKNDKGHFVTDKYWFDQYLYMDSETRDTLDDIFRTFSKQMDLVIQSAKAYIHINTGEFQNKKKAFNFFTEQEFIENIASNINKNSDFESFLDVVLNDLIKTTDESMMDIKENIDTVIKSELNLCFDKLSKNITQTNYRFDDLNRKIGLAKRELNEKIEHLKEWMAWKNESSQEFSFGSCIKASQEMLENLHPAIEIKCDVYDRTPIIVKGEHFRKFAMVFLILVDNAIIHTEGNPNINVTLNIDTIKDCNKISLLIKNKIIANKNSNTLKSIDIIKQKINSSYINDANKESGSGLFKVKKILTQDIKIDNNIELYLESGYFNVLITLDQEGLCNE